MHQDCVVPSFEGEGPPYQPASPVDQVFNRENERGNQLMITVVLSMKYPITMPCATKPGLSQGLRGATKHTNFA